MNKYIFILSAILSGLTSGILNTRSEAGTIRLATTTSTENSGLLKVLMPEFQLKTGHQVHVLSVGSGHALSLGKDGNVDVVLVHSPKAETEFINKKYGINRRKVMYNDFVIVGPKSDPAKVLKAENSLEALQRIASKKELFLSRGDDSGTHKKELELWEQKSISPASEWYREAGQGMGRVLQMASELNAYTLTDRGTWLVHQKESSLRIVFEQDPLLHNPYGIIAVNPKRYPDINFSGAMSLINWITSVAGQKLIREFTMEGQALFIPMAVTR